MTNGASTKSFKFSECEVFNLLLNSLALFIVCRTSCGREFQMAGPETEKPRRPNQVVSALGTTRSTGLAEQRFRWPALELKQFSTVHSLSNFLRGSSKRLARKQKNRATQIELYPLLGQRFPLDSPSEGSDGQRLRKRRHRVLVGKLGRCRSDSFERRGRS